MPYSTRFIATTLTESESDLYTIPTGYIAVVRDVEAFNESGDTANFAMQANVPGPLTAVFARGLDIVTNSAYQWTGRVVMNAGETLGANASAYDWILLVSGYLLSTP